MICPDVPRSDKGVDHVGNYHQPPGRRSFLGVALLADGISRREYAFIDRASLSDETGPLKLGFRNKSYNFAHVRSKAGDDAPAMDANIVPGLRPHQRFGAAHGFAPPLTAGEE